MSFTEEELEKHTDMTTSFLFSILGWKLSVEKLVDYESVCKVLGVKLDTSRTAIGLATFSNTDGRVSELLGRSIRFWERNCW